MSPFSIARVLVIGGIILVVTGGLVYLAARLGFRLGNLPGDIVIRRGNFTFSFPLVTSILISVVLTVLLNLAIRFFSK